MSQENVELVYRAADTLNRRDLNGFLALMADDVTVEPQLAERGYHGHDGIRRWWKAMVEGITGFTTDIVQVSDLGDDLVLALVRFSGQGATSAVPFEDMYWVTARWREGNCIWLGVFLTEGDALAAAGLRE